MEGFNAKQAKLKNGLVELVNGSGLPLGVVRDAMQLVMIEIDKAIAREIEAEAAQEGQDAEEEERGSQSP